jgi:hypothetical protein
MEYPVFQKYSKYSKHMRVLEWTNRKISNVMEMSKNISNKGPAGVIGTSILVVGPLL